VTKIIKLELNCMDDFFNKYNHHQVSFSVIKYLLNECSSEFNTYQIIIYNNLDLKIDLVSLIKETLLQEYEERQRIYKQTNIKQIWLLAIGIILLLISMGISEYFVFKEVILIAGWVLVWETIDIQLFRDVSERKTIKVLNKF